MERLQRESVFSNYGPAPTSDILFAQVAKGLVEVNQLVNTYLKGKSYQDKFLDKVCEMKTSLDILRTFISRRERRGATMEAVINRMKEDNILLTKRIDEEDKLLMEKLDIRDETDNEIDVDDFMIEKSSIEKTLERDSDELVAGGVLMDIFYQGNLPEKEPASVIHVAPPPVYESPEPTKKKKAAKKSSSSKKIIKKTRPPSARIALKENSSVTITAIIGTDSVVVQSTEEKKSPEKLDEVKEGEGDNTITISDGDESPSTIDPANETPVVDPSLPPVAVPVSDDELSEGDQQNDPDVTSPKSKRRRISNTLASRKLPDNITTHLKEWIYYHHENPYPTDEEKTYLCNKTNLTLTQLNNWFTNARRRFLKRARLPGNKLPPLEEFLSM